MKNKDDSIDNQLCPSCRNFDRDINGGPASADIWVVCEHNKESILNDEQIAKLAWKELREAINDLENKFPELNIAYPLFIEVNNKKFYDTHGS